MSVSYRTVIFILSILISLSYSAAQEFSPGPYGTGYTDIAGPFFLPDLNAETAGDVNFDGVLNVQDIIIVVGAVLGVNELSEEQFQEADTNTDGVIDILDIVSFVNMVLYPQPPGWDFEANWNGEESYIFIHYSALVNTSPALWASNTKQQLLENSPLNVHYFFLSDNFTYMADVANMQSEFETVLESLSPELQDHWRTHLHFIPVRSNNLGNWISDTIYGKYAFGIDRFQRIREVGYLGNPNGFTGTHMSYLAHEAIHYNQQWNLFGTLDLAMTEIAIFDSVLYSGGWSPTITSNIILPDDAALSTYTKMEVEAYMACAGYLDDNCDDYDRIAKLKVCEADGSDCREIARWITPFDRQPHFLTDITPYLAALRPGGEKQFKFTISGWPNSIIFIKLRFFADDTPEETPFEIIPLWNQTRSFNEDYNAAFDPIVFYVPEDASKVQFVSYITGHGMACDVGNCAEFCNSGHLFEINGGVGNFQKTHPEAGTLTHCMDLEQIANGVVPNQWGTWGYGRAGWCPGWEVAPFIQDISEWTFPGDDNVITYEGCFIQNESQGCTDWPAPVDCGGGYAAEINMSSYIIIWH